jgi:uncharacterized protein (DUF1778 family)
MATKRKAEQPRKKASGPNIPEEQRGSQQLKLRLLAEDARMLRAEAAERGMTVSDLVVAAVRAFRE